MVGRNHFKSVSIKSSTFKSIKVPFLPSIRKDSEEDYDKRARQLQEYLLMIARWPEVNSSELLKDFLSEDGSTW